MNAATVVSIITRALTALLLFFLSLTTFPPVILKAADWNIEQLMRSLAVTKSGRVTFIETKHIAMLDRPLVSTGILVFVAPDRLEKWTIKPEPESLRVDGDVLVIERKKQTYTLQLQDYPELAGLVDSMRGTLVGDRDALERLYNLKLEGSRKLWTLDLIPKEPKIAATIQMIKITGNNGDVLSIVVIQADGDRSLMVIDRVAAHLRLPQSNRRTK
jgi:Outer membrane lipoprotein carrier protein LolA-like